MANVITASKHTELGLCNVLKMSRFGQGRSYLVSLVCNRMLYTHRMLVYTNIHIDSILLSIHWLFLLLLSYYCLILYKLRSDSLILNEDDDDDDVWDCKPEVSVSVSRLKILFRGCGKVTACVTYRHGCGVFSTWTPLVVSLCARCFDKDYSMHAVPLQVRRLGQRVVISYKPTRRNGAVYIHQYWTGRTPLFDTSTLRYLPGRFATGWRRAKTIKLLT